MHFMSYFVRLCLCHLLFTEELNHKGVNPIRDFETNRCGYPRRYFQLLVGNWETEQNCLFLPSLYNNNSKNPTEGSSSHSSELRQTVGIIIDTAVVIWNQCGRQYFGFISLKHLGLFSFYSMPFQYNNLAPSY